MVDFVVSTLLKLSIHVCILPGVKEQKHGKITQKKKKISPC